MTADCYRAVFTPDPRGRVRVEILNLDPVLGDLRIPLPIPFLSKKRFGFTATCRDINDARLYVIGVVSYRRKHLGITGPHRIWYGDRAVIDTRTCFCDHPGDAHRTRVGSCRICELDPDPDSTCTAFAPLEA